MVDFLYKYEASIRLGIFLGGFALLALIEWYWPRRKAGPNKVKRWLNNLALVVTGTFLVRVLVPTAAIGMAYLVEKNNWGFTNYLEMNFWLQCIVTFILLDLIIYLQHLNFHVLPILWRMHRVHHSDNDCDVSTGLRFHPFELLVSIAIKLAAIAILGAPVLAVIMFEILLNFMSMFTHSNIGLNKTFEKYMRWLLVTPDMHRIHHSTRENETNSNFGFNISLWDRMFGTYMAEPRDGQQGMTIGLDNFSGENWQRLPGLLYMPFQSTIQGYAINYRDTHNADELEKTNKLLMAELEEKSKRERDLITAKRIADKANKAKSAFMTNMSHELHTPLHGILSYASLGTRRLDKASKDKLGSYFKNIKISGDRLLRLLDSLLDLSMLESDTLVMDKHVSDMHQTLDKCIEHFRNDLQQANISVELENTTNCNEAIFDPILIEKVINILLSNAIEYSPENSTVKVSMFNILGANDAPLLCVSVTDQGVGIPEEELTDIFNSFIQSSRTDNGEGGTGLGLAIARNIINKHNGSIWAEKNPEGKGSVFSFILPAAIENRDLAHASNI